MKTLYDILEIGRQASAEAIAASFRRLIADCEGRAIAAPGPELEMRRDAIVRAHAVLRDPQRRRDYDERLGLAAPPGRGRARDGLDPGPVRRVRRWARPLQSAAGLLALLYFATGSLSPPPPPGSVIAHATDRETGARDPAPAPPVAPSGSSAVPASAPLSTPGLGIAERRLEYERTAREQALLLERERLRLEVEVLRAQQARRDRELEAYADGQDRRLRMQERKSDRDQADAERAREQGDYWEQERRSRHEIDRQVGNAERTIELRKDAAAARLGIDRRQYDRLESRQWTESSGWNN